MDQTQQNQNDWHPEDWVTQMSPREWRQYLHLAMLAFHANPKDHEALEAIRHANTALGAYDEAEATGPGERIQQGLEQGYQAPVEMAKTVLGGLYNTVAHPVQTAEGLYHLPGKIAHALAHPQETWENIENSSPEDVAKGVGVGGAVLLPGARLGASGYSGAMEGSEIGPTVAGAVGRGLRMAGQPFKHMAERPGLRNSLLRAQISQAEQRAGDIMPEQAAQAKLRTQGMGQGLGMMDQRAQLLEGQIEQMPAGAERLRLSNELLELRIQQLRDKMFGGDEGEGGSAPVPRPQGPGPTGMGWTGNPSTYPEPSGSGPTQSGPGSPKAPNDILRGLTDQQLEEQPMGKTPPPNESGGAFNGQIQDQRGVEAIRGILDKENGPTVNGLRQIPEDAANFKLGHNPLPDVDMSAGEEGGQVAGAARKAVDQAMQRVNEHYLQNAPLSDILRNLLGQLKGK